MLPLNWIYLSSGRCLFLTIFLSVVLSHNLLQAHTYIWPLPDGFNDSDMVTIKGSLPIGGYGFGIYFAAGSDISNSDIIFHMAYRYAIDTVIFNTRNGSVNWMTEETYKEAGAVVAGRHFTTIIVLKCNQFMVATNGRHFVAFNVRKPTSYIKHVIIDADVTLSSMAFESYLT
ncbi:putative lymphatic endothelial cell migration [Trypoxylus dichotomus]